MENRADPLAKSIRGKNPQNQPDGEPKKKKENKDDGTDHPDPEIAEANRLRAALGLKPIKI